MALQTMTGPAAANDQVGINYIYDDVTGVVSALDWWNLTGTLYHLGVRQVSNGNVRVFDLAPGTPVTRRNLTNPQRFTLDGNATDGWYFGGQYETIGPYV